MPKGSGKFGGKAKKPKKMTTAYQPYTGGKGSVEYGSGMPAPYGKGKHNAKKGKSKAAY